MKFLFFIALITCCVSAQAFDEDLVYALPLNKNVHCNKGYDWVKVGDKPYVYKEVCIT